MSKSGNTITTDMNCRIIMKNIAKTRAKVSMTNRILNREALGPLYKIP